MQPAFPIPRRVAAIQSPIVPIVSGLIEAHPGTISLGQGVVHYPPPPGLGESVGAFLAEPLNHRYTPDWGLPALVEALAEKLARENRIDVAGRRVVVTAGANMAFLNTVLAVTDPGDEVILLAPYYFNHEMAVRLAACTPRIVSTDEGLRPRLDAIEAAIGERTRAVVTVSPNNPTGVAYSAAELDAVNALCAVRGLYHVSDEAYEYFVYGNASHHSPGAGGNGAGHTVNLFSLSKSYGLASWRVGYMVLPEALFEPAMKIQDTNVICAPAVSQHVALGCLEIGPGYARSFLPELETVRAMVLEELGALGDAVSIPRTEGAFYVYLRLDRGLSSFEVIRELIVRDGVAVIPGSAFGSDDGCYLRVSYGALRKDVVSEGIGRLVSGLRRIAKL